MIAIIDYGMGNLRSVQKGFEKVGVKAEIVRDPDAVESARGVVLPGVGAFADAMENLIRTGMDRAVIRAISGGRPFLGICLGLQLLFEASEEWGHTSGLGVFRGMVRRLPPGLKVPHMGWNQLNYRPGKAGQSVDGALLETNFTGGESCRIFRDIPEGSSFYFVHSYYVDPMDKDIVAGVTEYGIEFVSAVAKNNVYAIQFHPEKSSALGLRILQNFGGVVEKC
ncbi:MAG: imidazole glycerol phosphate synthase [Peptococcaceae bacterium BRH_c4b]|nr:MAG: imidazole glycerol phosphate synthase [Peptococcaceae bacterium BRH_c4b]